MAQVNYLFIEVQVVMGKVNNSNVGSRNNNTDDYKHDPGYSNIKYKLFPFLTKTTVTDY